MLTTFQNFFEKGLTTPVLYGIIYTEVKERTVFLMNAMLINLIARYNSIAFTHNYIMGFAYKGNIYAAKTVGLSFGIKLDRASSKNGGGYSIRFNPSVEEKKAMIKSGMVELICSQEYFDNMHANSKYNKGEIFEKIITERAGQVWVKDNVPFYAGADLTVNEIAYSIKFEKATICTETTLIKQGV